jgi:hypothetical protein
MKDLALLHKRKPEHRPRLLAFILQRGLMALTEQIMTASVYALKGLPVLKFTKGI